MTYQIESNSLEDTIAAGAAVGRNLKGGETLELIADLGGGKTAFARGLARGAGSDTEVASPSFTISRVYLAKKVTIYHYDFYRLDEPGIIENELRESLEDRSGTVVVEWAGTVAHVLPSSRVKARFEVTGDNSRKITFTVPEKWRYLLAGMM